MKHSQSFSVALAFALLLPLCGCEQGNTPADKKVSEAMDANAAAIKAKRDEYVALMHKRLDELNAKYEELKVRAAAATGDAKKELDRKVEQAKVKRDEAAKKIEELKTASLERSFDPQTEQLETVSLKPTKANISIELLTLVWAPYQHDASGQAKPAWQ